MKNFKNNYSSAEYAHLLLQVNTLFLHRLLYLVKKNCKRCKKCPVRRDLTGNTDSVWKVLIVFITQLFNSMGQFFMLTPIGFINESTIR